MGRIVIDLDPKEEDEFKRKAANRTYRETVLDALKIPYEPRTLGRPSSGIAFTSHVKNDEGLTLDQLRKKLDAKAKATREAEGKSRTAEALDNLKNDNSESRKYLKKIREG